MRLFNKEARTAGATQIVARGKTQTPETRPRRESAAIAETPLPRPCNLSECGSALLAAVEYSGHSGPS